MRRGSGTNSRYTELRAQVFPFFKNRVCAVQNRWGRVREEKYFFSAKGGVARLEGGMDPKKYGSGGALMLTRR